MDDVCDPRDQEIMGLISRHQTFMDQIYDAYGKKGHNPFTEIPLLIQEIIEQFYTEQILIKLHTSREKITSIIREKLNELAEWREKKEDFTHWASEQLRTLLTKQRAWVINFLGGQLEPTKLENYVQDIQIPEQLRHYADLELLSF